MKPEMPAVGISKISTDKYILKVKNNDTDKFKSLNKREKNLGNKNQRTELDSITRSDGWIESIDSQNGPPDTVAHTMKRREIIPLIGLVGFEVTIDNVPCYVDYHRVT